MEYEITFAIAPLVAGALIGGGVSLLNGLFNRSRQTATNEQNEALTRESWQKQALENAFQRSWQSGQNVDARNWASSEAATERAFNSAEAQKGRDWQEKMWNKENEYNSPAAQLRRMMDAGINPAMWNMDSNMAGSAPSTLSASSSSASAPMGSAGVGGFSSPIPMQSFSLENPLGGALDAANIVQQRDLVQSQINKNNADAGKSNAEAITIDALRSGQVELQGVQIQVGKSQSALNDAEAAKASAAVSEINAQTDVLKQQLVELQQKLPKLLRQLDVDYVNGVATLNLSKAQLTRLNIENANLDAFLKAEIRAKLAKAGLDEATQNLVTEKITTQSLLNGDLDMDLEMRKEGYENEKYNYKLNQQTATVVAEKSFDNPNLIFTMETCGKAIGGVAAGTGSFLGKLATLLR